MGRSVFQSEDTQRHHSMQGGSKTMKFVSNTIVSLDETEDDIIVSQR